MAYLIIIILLDDSDYVPTHSGDNEIREPPQKKINHSLITHFLRLETTCVYIKTNTTFSYIMLGVFMVDTVCIYCPVSVINRSFCATDLMPIESFTHNYYYSTE